VIFWPQGRVVGPGQFVMDGAVEQFDDVTVEQGDLDLAVVPGNRTAIAFRIPPAGGRLRLKFLW